MPAIKRLDPTVLDNVVADGGQVAPSLKVLTEGKSKKHRTLLLWQIVLGAISPNRITDRKVTIKPEDVGKTYLIGTEFQRTVDEAHVRTLTTSFAAVPHFLSTLILCTKKGGPKDVYYTADGQHRLAAVIPYGKPKTFAAMIYLDCTPDEMRALFDANIGRRATAQDILNAHRDAAPAYQRYKEFSEAFLPVKINLVKQPGQIRWIDVFSAFNCAERNVLTRVGHSTEQCVVRWKGEESLKALDELLMIVRAVEIGTYELNRQRADKKDPATVGDLLVRLLNPLASPSPTALRDQEAKIEKGMKQVRSLAGTPSNRPHPGIYGENMLRLLFTLRRHNNWPKLLRRIPYLLNRLMPQDYKLTTHGEFENLLEIVLKALNQHARGEDALHWPGRTKLGAARVAAAE